MTSRPSAPRLASLLVAGVLVVAAAAAAASLAACDGTTPGVSAPADMGRAPLVLAVTPGSATAPVGVKVPFTVRATRGGQPVDPSDATWVSSDAGVAIIDGLGVARGLHAGTVTISAGVGAVAASATLTITAAVMTSLTVTPAMPQLPLGVTQQFAASATFTDGTSHDVTPLVTWSSATPAVATIDATSGVATALAPGTSVVTASAPGGGGGDPLTATATLTVITATVKSIAVAPDMVAVVAGGTQQFQALATLTDGSTLDVTGGAGWVSTAPAVALVNNGAKKGLATGVLAGTTAILASVGLVTGKATLTVTGATLATIALSPALPVAAVGTRARLAATGLYTDSTTQDLTATATWASSDPKVATVDATGLVSALAPGMVTLTATLGDRSGSTPFTVTAATLVSLAVTPPLLGLPAHTAARLRATGTFSDGSAQDLTDSATWTSGAPAVATVSDAAASKGQLAALQAGSATVRATFGKLVATTAVTVSGGALASLTVTPAAPVMGRGARLQLSATGLYADHASFDLADTVTWSTTNPNVASVGPTGLLVAGTNGTAVVTATLGALTATTLVTVLPNALVAIQVAPVAVALARGTSGGFQAAGVFADGSVVDLTRVVTWSSSSTVTALVSNGAGTRGVVTAVAPGSANLVATLGTVSGSVAITVTAATLKSLQITPPATTLPAGTGATPLVATGVFSDGTTQDLGALAAWSSSAPDVAQVATCPALVPPTGAPAAPPPIAPAGGTAAAELRALAPGKATVTARVGAIQASATVTVTAATLTALVIVPALPTVAVNTTVALTAIGVYSDRTTRDLTRAVTFVSATPAVAVASNASTLASAVGGPAPAGVVKGLAPGTSGVTAWLGALTASVSLTVSPATLVYLTVAPQNVTLARATAARFRAFGTFSDGSTQELTRDVGWSSPAAFVASAPGSEGVAIGFAPAVTTVRAVRTVLNNVQIAATARLVVTAATPSAITVVPPLATVPRGALLPLLAVATFSDGSVQDLVGAGASWFSSDPTVAPVSNALGPDGVDHGVVFALAKGAAQVTAARGMATGTAQVTVTPAVLQSIQVTAPPLGTLARATTQQLVATALYSDGSRQDVTARASWTSSAPAVAVVGSAGAGNGQVVGVAKGAALVSATVDGVTGSAAVGVSAAVPTAVAVQCPAATLPAGFTSSCRAEATFSDGTKQDVTALASWSSSENNAAVVINGDAAGLVYALAPGMAGITAALGVVKGTDVLTVSGATLTALAIAPSSPTFKAGTVAQLVATGTFSDGTMLDVTPATVFTSSKPTVATVAHARLYALSPGATLLKATLGTISATTTLTLN